jgi:hypothetical protein
MRSSGSGPSSEAEPEPPYDRALRLLVGYLDEVQREDLRKWRGFRHRDRQRLYWIPLEGAPRCADLSVGKIHIYCVHTTGGWTPRPDQALTYLTWLRTDPNRFIKWANVRRSLRVPKHECEEELCEFLSRAESYRLSPYEREQLPYVPPPTEEQKRIGLAHSRRLKKQLRIELLRDRLALVDLGDQRILERLAEDWPF